MKHDTTHTPAELRRLAEERLEARAQTPPSAPALSRVEGLRVPPSDARMLHELQVHQIELEMQNEELRTAQAQIEAGRARYFDLYDLAPVGYCTLSEQGLILEANLTAATLLGVARGALVKQPISRFVVREDQDLYYLHRKRLLDTHSTGPEQAGAPQTCELRLVKPDGTAFWARLDATATGGSDGPPTYRVVLSDITERKSFEAALRESDLRFSHLFQHVPNVAVQGYGPDGTTLYWNEASERLYGYTAQEALGRNLVDLIIPPEMRDVVKQLIQQMAETGQQIPASEVWRMRKDGSQVSVFSSHATVQMPGQPLTLFCIDIDITARVQAEDATRRAEKRSGALIENAPDGIVFVSTDGKFTYASPTAYRLFGYGTDEMSQLDPNILTHPDDLPRMLTVLSGVIQNPSLVTTLQYRFQHKDGRWLWIESTFSNLIAEPSIQAIVINFRDITERKRAEDSLRESEERFKAIANYAVSWESWFGPEGKYIWVNPAVEHFTGYSAQEILALPDFVSTVIADEDRATFRGRFQEAIRGSREDDFEFRYLHKNGTKRWLSVSWQPIYDAQGNPLGTRSSGYDITARKQAEEALKRSKDLLSETELIGKVGGWSFNIDTMQQTWTDEVYRIHEVEISPDPSVERGIGFYTAESRPIIEKAVQRAIEFGEEYDLDLEIITAEGNTRAVHAIGKADLENRRIYGFFQDITERKQAEAALRESEEKYRALYEHMDAASCLDEVIYENGKVVDYRILDINPSFVRITGISRAQAVGMLASQVYGPGPVPFLDTYAKVAETGEPASFEAFFAPIGKHLHIIASCPAKGRFSTILTDITERKRAEVEHEKLQAQLQQVQKMESIGRLAGGVAHDLNNMLTGIMGYTELARDEIEANHPVREFLDEVMASAQRSAGIAQQLLAFARKQIIAPRVLDLNDALEGMLRMLRRLIGEDIKLTWRPGVDLRPVRCDPAQVDQILANLCVNARDAIAGVGEVTVETGNIAIDAEYCTRHPEAIPGAYVFLAVGDDGCGMDKETLAQVFEPFFTTKGIGKGTGLGLATVYGIVKQNNGFISATSEPGKGTVFKIHLPAIVAEAEAAVTSKAEAPRGRGETVLLVEDEESVRMTCCRFLEALGYKVLAAETPGEALKMTDQHPGDIHALLTDVVMPGMDGRQLAKRIRAVRPGVKVLFMSGYSADVIAQRGVLDDGVHFLSKPFTRDDLARKVRELLEAD